MADWFRDYLEENPFDVGVFTRFVEHIAALMENEDPAENTVLVDGFF